MDAAPQHITASRSNVDTGVLSPDVTLMNKDTYKDAVLSTNCFSVLQRLNSSALLVSLRHTSRRTRWIISILLALTIILIVTVLSVLLSRGTVSAVGSIVNLSYGSYQGVPLSNGITQWLGLRYAAPPIGNLRFASPTDPVPFDGIKIANKTRFGCMGVGPTFDNKTESEDCLFLDLYAPSSANKDSKLPVFVWIQGGGFNGDGGHQNVTKLIEAAQMNMIVVTFTYRGAALGFLAGQEIRAEGASFNNGLRDQRKVLQWVQDYIQAFGGDANHVVLGGQSAGAGSVLNQMLAFSGRDDGLFHAAISESPSMPAIRTIDESQYQYDALVRRARCNSTVDTLACLRSMDITSFQQANLPDPFPEPGVNGDPIWAYNPCLDGVFIQDYSVKQLHEGRFVVIPTMFGSNTNEGTIFADQSDETTVDLQSFLMRQFPMLTNNMLETYAELYDFNLNSTLQPYWYNEAAAYGETRYICSSMYSSTAFNNGSTSNHWVYHFDQNDPTFGDLLVLHGAELGAVWGMGGPPGFYSQNAYIVSLVQDYWASFIQTFNPNTKKLASAPVWDSWDAQKLNRMHLIARQPGMEILDAGTRDRCQWLESIAVDIRQ